MAGLTGSTASPANGATRTAPPSFLPSRRSTRPPWATPPAQPSSLLRPCLPATYLVVSGPPRRGRAGTRRRGTGGGRPCTTTTGISSGSTRSPRRRPTRTPTTEQTTGSKSYIGKIYFDFKYMAFICIYSITDRLTERRRRIRICSNKHTE